MAPVIDAALERLGRLETLAHAYEVWGALRAEHAAFLLACESERRRLQQQGAFLVGAVRAAAGPVHSTTASAGDALVAPGGGEALQQHLREAEEKMKAALDALAQRVQDDGRRFEDAFAQIRSDISTRVERRRQVAPPAVRVIVRAVGSSRTLLHVERVRDDAAVLLLHALTGRIPSRYGYLEDDSTEDVRLPPAPLYAEEGVAAGQTRPSTGDLQAYLRSAPAVLAVKGFVPVFVPSAEVPGDEEFYRLLQRGPVLEVERRDGDAFRNLLTQEEGERFAGHLLRLKLSGTLALELTAD